MMAHSVVNALFGSYDLRSSKQWRDEDMSHREQEIQWLNDEIVRAHAWRVADIERSLRTEKIEHEHLLCEARAEQLHTVSEQCALLGGFTVIAMSNLDIPAEIHITIVFLYGASATLVCVLLILATVMCTMLLVAVTRYAGHSLEVSVKQMDLAQLEVESPFGKWWLKTCEREQMRAYKFMGVGIVLFFFYLSVLSWVQFHKSAYASSTISILCFVAVLAWQLRIASRWRYLLMPPTDRPFTPSHSIPMPSGSSSGAPEDTTTSAISRKSSFLEFKRAMDFPSPAVIPSPANRLKTTYVSMHN
jgi:calcium release-activated calcium channel protein 1